MNDQKVTISIPDFSAYFADWGFWSWFLAYCCVLWFIGFFYSILHVRKLVKCGDLPDNSSEKATEGLLNWLFFPIKLPVMMVFSLIKISRIYDFKK